MDDYIAISTLQHDAYYPRQFALIHIEQAWEENRLTAEGWILHQRVDSSAPVSWQCIQENSVQLWVNRINTLNLKVVKGCLQDNIYSWTDTYEYDPNFLGIMAGIINPKKFFEDTGGVL